MNENLSVLAIILSLFLKNCYGQCVGTSKECNTTETCSTPCELNEEVILKSIGDSKVIQSPGYPEKYCNEQNCGWKVTGPTNSTIQIIWNDVDMEEDYDEVLVFDGPTIRQEPFYNCTGSECERVVSPSSRIYIDFYSDEEVTGRGFKATATSTIAQLTKTTGKPTTQDIFESTTAEGGSESQTDIATTDDPHDLETASDLDDGESGSDGEDKTSEKVTTTEGIHNPGDDKHRKKGSSSDRVIGSSIFIALILVKPWLQ